MAQYEADDGLNLWSAQAPFLIKSMESVCKYENYTFAFLYVSLESSPGSVCVVQQILQSAIYPLQFNMVSASSTAVFLATGTGLSYTTIPPVLIPQGLCVFGWSTSSHANGIRNPRRHLSRVRVLFGVLLLATVSERGGGI